MNYFKVVAVSVFTVFLYTGVLSADNRVMVWNYQYQTMERGAAEVEYYHTISTPTAARVDSSVSVEQQVELEIGMTDRFDFSIYQVFGQSPGKTLVYKAFKTRFRFRTGALDGDWLKPVVYAEYKANPDFTEQKFEIKPILGKHFPRWDAALNPVGELVKKASEGGSWEFEAGWNAGVAYKVNKLLHLGLELTRSDDGTYLGPTIAHGYGHLWVALGSGFAISDVAADVPELKVRLLIGVNVAKGSGVLPANE